MRLLTDTEIKNELLEMLKKVDGFFNENGIRYSISSGTLLGAVRHKGFIPWDDDIDIAILRPDYNRLIDILRKDNSIGELKGVGFELGNSYLPFLKIVNPEIGTEEIITDGVIDRGNLWLDIFPFDGIPENDTEEYMKYLDKKLRKIYDYKRCSLEFPAMPVPKRWKFLVHFVNFKHFINYYIKKCSMYEIEECKSVRDSTWGTKAVPKDLFDEITEYDFENTKVKGLKDYDRYLSILYGNYMELPPAEKRVNHGLKAFYRA